MGSQLSDSKQEAGWGRILRSGRQQPWLTILEISRSYLTQSQDALTSAVFLDIKSTAVGSQQLLVLRHVSTKFVEIFIPRMARLSGSIFARNLMSMSMETQSVLVLPTRLENMQNWEMLLEILLRQMKLNSSEFARRELKIMAESLK